MTQPDFLKPGDTVALVSTARKISRKELLPAISLLGSWGLKLKIGNSIGLEENQFAGTDETRATDFQDMLDDPGVKAIWCARGGYGTARIIDRLDFSGFLKSPKWIIGFSDITVLHSQMNVLGLQSIHAQMAHQIETRTGATRETLKKAIFGNPLEYIFPTSKKNRLGKAEGELVGGNLSVLYSLLGSPTSISTKAKILFLEDLDEYLYHIDRMMLNLKRNGYFDNLKGLIVGGMSDMRDNTKEFGFDKDNPFGKTAGEIVWETVKDYDFPVVFGFPAGHLNDNRALIFGKPLTMEISAEETKLVYG